MALERCCRDSVASASTDGENMSCFTLPSTKVSGTTKASSVPSQRSRLLTGDSARIQGGICKRRKEMNTKSPMQWPADAQWLKDVYEKEGPAGLQSTNYMP